MGTTVFLKKFGGNEIVEPALTPPSLKVPPLPKPKLGSAKSKSKKRDIPEGLWTKCPKCSTMIFDKELDEKLKVCPKCSNHFPISARERIHSLAISKFDPQVVAALEASIEAGRLRLSPTLVEV